MRKSKVMILLIPCLLLGGFSIFYFLIPYSSIVIKLGIGGSNLNQFFYSVSGYIVLLFGAFMGSGFRKLLEMKKEGIETLENPILFVLSIARSVDFWLGVFGSILIYSAVLQGIQDVSITTFYYMALEKGFLLTSIIEQTYNQLVATSVKNN